MRRPLLSRPYLGAWLVLLWSVYLGFGPIGISVWPPGLDPSSRLAINYDVYYYAAEALVAGEDIYTVYPPDQSPFYVFLYPPITVFAFLPYTLVDPHTGFLIHTALSVVLSGVSAYAIVRYVERWDLTLGWFDMAAIWLFFVASVHSTGTINFGNINLLLAAGIVIGFVSLDRGREATAGVLFGLVALMKVFPALVGLYLLRIKSWRAIVAATATGLGGLLASVVVFGPRTLYRFFFEVLMPRGDTLSFVGGYPPGSTYYVTLQRPLSHIIWGLWEGAPAELLPIVTALILGSVVGFCYINLETRTDHLVAIHATLTATVIFMPSLRWYLALLFFSWVSLLYVWYDSSLLPLFAMGGLLATITDRPSDMLERAESYPWILSSVMESVYAVGTMQLYGLLIMLVVCLIYKRRQGVGIADIRPATQALKREARDGVRTVKARLGV